MTPSLFLKNLNALNNTFLKEELKKIKSNLKFELIQGKDNLDINLKEINGGGELLYQNPLAELNSMLNTYNDKYFLYPVL
ncbi:motility associated factor glycosyltransferase family protein, partial [Campylobacter sp. TTU-622]|nr:motility associated factor glycosyltransferase family protein [Campylobacter sp. TTU-622]